MCILFRRFLLFDTTQLLIIVQLSFLGMYVMLFKQDGTSMLVINGGDLALKSLGLCFLGCEVVIRFIFLNSACHAVSAEVLKIIQ
jgi:hypothetical protein